MTNTATHNNNAILVLSITSGIQEGYDDVRSMLVRLRRSQGNTRRFDLIAKCILDAHSKGSRSAYLGGCVALGKLVGVTI